MKLGRIVANVTWGLLSIILSGVIFRICSDNKTYRQAKGISVYGPSNTITIPDDWTKYEFINSYVFSVPDKMELRHDYDVYTRWLAEGLGFISSADAVFQQKDLSSFSAEAKDTYARILMQHYSISYGEVDHFYEYPSLEEEDKLALNEMVEGEVSPCSFIDLPKWRVIDLSGTKAIEGTYRRTGFEGPVKCKFYLLSNYNEMVKVIVAYREKDSDIWEEDLNKVIYSFKWKNPQ